MDIIFFLTGCLLMAETIDLFMDKDFLIFISDSIDPADYDIKKVYRVEKWLFAIDTLACFGIAMHLGGLYGELFMMGIIFATLFAHWKVFRDPQYRVKGRERKGKKRGGKK